MQASFLYLLLRFRFNLVLIALADLIEIKSLFSQLKFENSNSLEALLNYADGVGMTSSRSANDERLSIQELFKTRQLIQMELDEALIKEVRFVSSSNDSCGATTRKCMISIALSDLCLILLITKHKNIKTC